MCNNKSCRSSDLDYSGDMFGLRYQDDEGAPKGCIELYVEDDEFWHYVCSFNHFWITDLVSVLAEARKHFNTIAENATDVKATETRPVPEVQVN